VSPAAHSRANGESGDTGVPAKARRMNNKLSGCAYENLSNSSIGAPPVEIFQEGWESG
jgi:hypothetical protein